MEILKMKRTKKKLDEKTRKKVEDGKFFFTPHKP
jgi:uncharacterized protein YlaI